MNFLAHDLERDGCSVVCGICVDGDVDRGSLVRNECVLYSVHWEEEMEERKWLSIAAVKSKFVYLPQ